MSIFRVTGVLIVGILSVSGRSRRLSGCGTISRSVLGWPSRQAIIYSAVSELNLIARINARSACFSATKWGHFFKGRRDDWIARLEFRPGPYVFFSGEYQQNDVRLAWGNFAVRLVRARLNLALNPDLSWFAFGQYDTVSDTLGMNTQVRWIIEPGNEFFIIYNHNLLIRDGDIHSTIREGRVKMRYTYRF